MISFRKHLFQLLLAVLLLGLVPDAATATTRVGRESEVPLDLPIYRITGIMVSVPDDLTVSEADRLYPLADIVWHGDPPGDRPTQVIQIFREAIAAATAGQQTGPAATLEIEVRRFHGLTRKARYTYGGLQEIRFDLTLRDPDTGEVLYGPEPVIANLRAPNGARALAEELQEGRSQRTVVVAWLSHVIRRQIALPNVATATR